MSSGNQAGRSCPNCHRWIPGGTEFCRFCDSQQQPSSLATTTPPSDERLCARCHSPLDVSQQFCANCGMATGHPAPSMQPSRTSPEPYNGWAIASLVVSLMLAISAPFDVVYGRATHAKAFISYVPTAVIGLVAVTLGWVALQKFKSSPRPLRGRLAALIGMRLGVAGFVGGLVMTLLLPSFFARIPFMHSVTTAGTSINVPWGRTENVTSTDLGLSTIQVIAVHSPVQLVGPPPFPNYTYWAVALRICAGPSGAADSDLPVHVEAHTSRGDVLVPSQYLFRSSYPAVLRVELKSNQCEIYYAEGFWQDSQRAVLYQMQLDTFDFNLTK